MLEPLSIDVAIDEIRAQLRHHRAVVIVAEPGSGKTTRVPPSLLDAGPAIVLQPRRTAARSIARRIADERGWTPGVEVGWHVRFERNFRPDTRLILATEGILTARLQQDPLLSGFTTIVLDEFHERSIHSDLAIALARQTMIARDDLHLVVMSATIDAERVSSFLGDCGIVRVPGRRHAVAVRYAPSLGPADAVKKVLQETSGSILCFQPGAVEIGRTIDALHSAGLSPDVEMLPLHGTLPSAQQDIALTSSRGSRRVIVCTNIAETSITVPGVAAVVDSGLEKVARYDAERAIDSLTTERISQAAADQRAGRAGRTGPGVVYRLWSASDRLRPFREPEIHRVDMSGLVLDVAGWGGDARTLEWFDPPRAEALAAAIALLNRMDALHGAALTDIGRRMLRVPLHPRLARIVAASNGDPHAIRAAAVLSERIPFEPCRASTPSDLLSILDRWNELPQHVHALATQIDARAGGHGGLRPSPESDRALRRAVFTGYPDRVARRREPHSPRFLMSTGTGAVQSEQSGVRDAEFIVALDLRAAAKDESQSRISVASAIERSWLTPTSIQREHELDSRGAVRAREVERYDALVLAQRAVSPDPETAVDLLAAEWLARPLPDDVGQLMCRISFAGCTIDLSQLVRTAAYGETRLDDIEIQRVLPGDVVREVERYAPESLLLPSGRHVRLDYAADGQVSASVKLQELFGLAETPRIGPRNEPILLALLAPNGRPVQLTRDLKSFWDRTYPEVRKELRGRYPRHPWPEDPWKAQPTHRTNRRR